MSCACGGKGLRTGDGRSSLWRYGMVPSEWLFELLTGAAKLRERLFEMIAKNRHAEQVFSRSSVVGACGLCAEVIPISKIAVAAPEPGHCHQVDLLVLIQPANDCRQFALSGIIAVIFQYGKHGIIGGVRAG